METCVFFGHHRRYNKEVLFPMLLRAIRDAVELKNTP